MRFVLLVLIAGCWRGGATTSPRESGSSGEAVSFVVRVTGLATLQRDTAELEPRLADALRRILGLANETERTAIRDDLRELATDILQLGARAHAARDRGEQPVAVRRIEDNLAAAMVTLAKLHQGLRHANTLEELQAMQHRPKEPLLDDDGRVDVVLSPGPAPTLRWRHSAFGSP